MSSPYEIIKNSLLSRKTSEDDVKAPSSSTMQKEKGHKGPRPPRTGLGVNPVHQYHEHEDEDVYNDPGFGEDEFEDDSDDEPTNHSSSIPRGNNEDEDVYNGPGFGEDEFEDDSDDEPTNHSSSIPRGNNEAVPPPSRRKAVAGTPSFRGKAPPAIPGQVTGRTSSLSERGLRGNRPPPPIPTSDDSRRGSTASTGSGGRPVQDDQDDVPPPLPPSSHGRKSKLDSIPDNYDDDDNVYLQAETHSQVKPARVMEMSRRAPLPTPKDIEIDQRNRSGSCRSSRSSTASSSSESAIPPVLPSRPVPEIPISNKKVSAVGRPKAPTPSPKEMQFPKTAPKVLDPPQEEYEIIPAAIDKQEPLPSPRNKSPKKPWKFSQKRSQQSTPNAPPVPTLAPPSPPGEVYEELPEDNSERISGDSTTSNDSRPPRGPLPGIPPHQQMKEQRLKKFSSSSSLDDKDKGFQINTMAIKNVRLRKTSQDLFEPPLQQEQVKTEEDDTASKAVKDIKSQFEQKGVYILNSIGSSLIQPLIIKPQYYEEEQMIISLEDSGIGSLGESPVGSIGRKPMPRQDQLQLTECLWYHGDIGRKGAETLMSSCKRKGIYQDGTYLVRNSTRGGPQNPYTLSLYYRSEMKNLHIRKRPDSKFALGSEKPNEMTFDTVPEMIFYHQNNPIIIAGGQGGETVLKQHPRSKLITLRDPTAVHVHDDTGHQYQAYKETESIISENEDYTATKMIKVSSKGGIYYMKDADIMISIPNNTLSSTSEVVVMSRPASGCISTDEANILSEMITILPHNTVFNQHVLVKFPLVKSKLHQDDQIDLLYSENEVNEEYNWVRLKQHDTSCKHSDDIFWFTDSEHCYLFIKHCCHFVLLKQSGKPEQQAVQLCTSLHAIWNKQKLNDLQVVVAFHCHRCNDINLENRTDLGVCLQKQHKFIFDGCGPVTVSVQLDSERWVNKHTTEALEFAVEELMLLCNPYMDVCCQKFIFILKNNIVYLDKELELCGTAKISQKNYPPLCIPFITSLDKLVQEKTFAKATTNTDANISQTRGEVKETQMSTRVSGIQLAPLASKFEDETDEPQTSEEEIEDGEYFSCDDDESSNDSQTKKKVIEIKKEELLGATGGCNNNTTNIQFTQNITQIYAPTNLLSQYSLPCQPRVVDCVFHSSVEHEENKLCRILDNDCKEKLNDIAKSVGDLNGTVDKKNITGLSLLQVWQTHVQSKECTWKQFYEILIELNCKTAAQQLKVVYEKDKLLCELKKLRQYLRLKDISATLVSEDIIDVSERSLLLNMGDENKAVEHFVLDFLIRRDYKFLAKFHKVLSQDRYHTEWISELVLCPEELE